MKEVKDIADMPGFNPEVQNHPRSVSEGRVKFGRTPWMEANGSLPTVYCTEHGAMNKVGKNLWRCLTCHVGAYEKEDLCEGS